MDQLIHVLGIRNAVADDTARRSHQPPGDWWIFNPSRPLIGRLMKIDHASGMIEIDVDYVGIKRTEKGK
jgi:hypothetical protein